MALNNKDRDYKAHAYICFTQVKKRLIHNRDQHNFAALLKPLARPSLLYCH